MARKTEKTNAMRILDRAGISYKFLTYPHDDGGIDGISVARKLGEDPDCVFKTLVTKGPAGTHFVFMIPVAESLDLKAAAKAAGVKSVEMIPVSDLLKTTGYIRGGCSPIGMKKAFPTFIDETAELFDTIYLSAGKIGAQVGMNPSDLVKLVGAVMTPLTASEQG